MEVCGKVWLGIPDGLIPDNDQNIWNVNKFGGYVSCPEEEPFQYPQCNLCNATLLLVAQIYCPLEHSLYHRILYIFGCITRSCWNDKDSWRVLRWQKLDNQQKVIETSHNQVHEDIWCDDADNWAEDDQTVEAGKLSLQLEQLENETATLSLNENNEINHQKVITGKQQHFLPYYINVVDEYFFLSDDNKLSENEQRLLTEYQTKEGLCNIKDIENVNMQKDWSGEKYEQNCPKDKIFQKFVKQVGFCPEQCLRYSLNGKPLLMTEDTIGPVPLCTMCGEKRQFELQLMPALVLLLRLNKQLNVTENGHFLETQSIPDSGNCLEVNSDIEFGCIYVFTCSENCWTEEANVVEEYTIIQSEPEQHTNITINKL